MIAVPYKIFSTTLSRLLQCDNPRMVISSILTPSSQPHDSSLPSLTFDHTYSKNSMSFNMPGSPLPAEAAPMFLEPSNMLKENSGQTETSCTSNMDEGDTTGLSNCHNSNHESEMMCDFDFDDLDLSLSDFDMVTESDAKGSFQDFVDNALSLSSSADTPRPIASVCAPSFAANLGRQETRSIALSSNCSCTSSMFISPASSLVKQTDSSFSGTLPTEDLAAKHPSQTPIPTKNFSSPEFEPDGTVLCLYSSCQRDETTLSSSTCRTKLKPGDYLPPLYIDTQNYGVVNVTDSSTLLQEVPSEKRSLNFPSERHPNASDIETQHFDTSVCVTCSSLSTSTVTTAAATTMCRDSSCVLTPLSLSDLSHSDTGKSPEQYDEEMDELSDSCFTETPSNQFDDLDLESVTDLKKYLTEAKLDLSKHTSPHPQPDCDSQTTIHQNGSNQWIQEKDADTLSISGLRLSILDDFATKHELISWLDACAFGEAPTPPISPDLSPGWRELADVQNTGRTSKHETNILDLFSDDNAHAFLSDDSAICQMHVSQFI